jgi:hypothetical protein
MENLIVADNKTDQNTYFILVAVGAVIVSSYLRNVDIAQLVVK